MCFVVTQKQSTGNSRPQQRRIREHERDDENDTFSTSKQNIGQVSTDKIWVYCIFFCPLILLFGIIYSIFLLLKKNSSFPTTWKDFKMSITTDDASRET